MEKIVAFEAYHTARFETRLAELKKNRRRFRERTEQTLQ